MTNRQPHLMSAYGNSHSSLEGGREVQLRVTALQPPTTTFQTASHRDLDGTSRETVHTETTSVLPDGKTRVEMKREENTVYPDGSVRTTLRHRDSTTSGAPPPTSKESVTSREHHSSRSSTRRHQRSAESASRESRRSARTHKKVTVATPREQERAAARARAAAQVAGAGGRSHGPEHLIPVGFCQGILPLDSEPGPSGGGCGTAEAVDPGEWGACPAPLPSHRPHSEGSPFGRREHGFNERPASAPASGTRAPPQRPPWIVGPWPAPCTTGDKSQARCRCNPAAGRGGGGGGGGAGALHTIMRGVSALVRPRLPDVLLAASHVAQRSRPLPVYRYEPTRRSSSSSSSSPEVTVTKTKKSTRVKKTKIETTDPGSDTGGSHRPGRGSSARDRSSPRDKHRERTTRT